MKRPTPDEMRAYLEARAYVSGERGGWQELAVGRWTYFPKDRRRRASDDYSLEMAYQLAVEGRFDR